MCAIGEYSLSSEGTLARARSDGRGLIGMRLEGEVAGEMADEGDCNARTSNHRNAAAARAVRRGSGALPSHGERMRANRRHKFGGCRLRRQSIAAVCSAVHAHASLSTGSPASGTWAWWCVRGGGGGEGAGRSRGVAMPDNQGRHGDTHGHHSAPRWRPRPGTRLDGRSAFRLGRR